MSHSELTSIYNRRFRSSTELRSTKSRDNAWKALYEKVLKKHIERDFKVLDLGSGPGYFINQVEAASKYAVDLDQNNAEFLNSDVSFQCTKSQDLSFAPDNSVNIVFSSNLFEHLGTSEVLLETLREIHRVLREENSKLIVLMPNIRYAKWDFYNFIDHNLPLTEVSLKEALELCNFEIIEAHKKFFPYSANGISVSTPTFIVKLYLQLPPFLRPRAKQMFCIARPIKSKI